VLLPLTGGMSTSSTYLSLAIGLRERLFSAAKLARTLWWPKLSIRKKLEFSGQSGRGTEKNIHGALESVSSRRGA